MQINNAHALTLQMETPHINTANAALILLTYSHHVRPSVINLQHHKQHASASMLLMLQANHGTTTAHTVLTLMEQQ